MKARVVLTGVFLAVACSGCQTPGVVQAHVQLPDNLHFTEQEVHSRVWRDASGRTLSLIEWSVQHLKQHSTILIAKYGDPRTGFVTCLDFYEIHELPSPYGVDLVFRGHDIRAGRVAAVEVTEQGRNIFFEIRREPISHDGNQHSEQYDLCYTEGHLLVNGTHYIH